MTVTTATTEDGTTTTTTDTLYFAYDAAGTPQTVTHNGTTYYYSTNLQGDVVSILNASGTAVVSYTYDAWGNILTTSGSMASTLGTVNPLTYRGYVYDTETEYYYLQSRYYNPTIGRFINADAFTSTGQGIIGCNMFGYCGNNPVIRKDIGGQYWVYTIEEVKTEVIEETEKGTKYRTTITYSVTSQSIFGCRADDPVYYYEVPFEYTVTNTGVILYDNKQPVTSHLGVFDVRRKLAKEMYDNAQIQVEGALEGRSVSGISAELELHQRAYSWGIFSKNAEESYIGGNGRVGYDKNGWFFELLFGW